MDESGRTLAIECATESCSAALFADGRLVDQRFEAIGRGHAERLIPMIAELPDRGRAERILVSLGPGSFTGVRIGLAAARALGLAWSARVIGYPTLHLIRAMAASDTGEAVTVCMNGGHGEYFVQNFAADGTPQDDARSLPPTDAADACRNGCIAGNRAQELAALLDRPVRPLSLLPDAAHAMALNDASFTTDLTLIYGRAPDAQPAAGR